MGGWRRCVGGVGHGAASFTIRGGHCSAAKRYRHGGRYRSDQAYFATCASVSMRIDTSSPSIPAIAVMPKYERLMVVVARSEEHTSELKSLMSRSYAVFCWKKKNNKVKQKVNEKQK